MKKFSQSQPDTSNSTGENNVRDRPVKKNPNNPNYKPEGNTIFEKIPNLAKDTYLYNEYLSKSGAPPNIDDNFFYEPTSNIRNEYLESVKALEKQAKDLRTSNQYSDSKKSILTKEIFDNNPFAIEVELERLNKLVSLNQKTIKDFTNAEIDLPKYKSKLRDQLQNLKTKLEYQDLGTSSSILGSAGRMIDVKPSENLSEATGRRDLEALRRLIRARQENIADIESYIFGLVTGIDQFSAFMPNIAHTNARFIKVAEDDMVKEADEEIEDYYNELYQGSEGSPDFGTALEHPKETRNELTTKIQHHKFRKK